MSGRAGFLQPLLSSPHGKSLVVARTGQAIASTVTTAFDSASRRQGLLGRSALADGEALIIAPSGAVHTFGMRFAIDLLFVSRDGSVVKVHERVQPRRLSLCWRAFGVVELAAGRVGATGVRVGDRVKVRDETAQGTVMTIW